MNLPRTRIISSNDYVGLQMTAQRRLERIIELEGLLGEALARLAEADIPATVIERIAKDAGITLVD